LKQKERARHVPSASTHTQTNEWLDWSLVPCVCVCVLYPRLVLGSTIYKSKTPGSHTHNDEFLF
jgi:hypothetical protein